MDRRVGALLAGEVGRGVPLVGVRGRSAFGFVGAEEDALDPLEPLFDPVHVFHELLFLTQTEEEV